MTFWTTVLAVITGGTILLILMALFGAMLDFKKEKDFERDAEKHLKETEALLAEGKPRKKTKFAQRLEAARIAHQSSKN